MRLEEFDFFVKELFTDNIYNLFLLYGFDLPILKNKGFAPARSFLHNIDSYVSCLELKSYILYKLFYWSKSEMLEIIITQPGFGIKQIAITFFETIDMLDFRNKTIFEMEKHLRGIHV